MDNTLFLQRLRESSLEEGRAYIQSHLEELADHAAIGTLLADEALAQLYTPFLSLKLAELLIFFGEYTQHLSSHALGLKAKGDALVQIRHFQAALDSLDIAGEEFLHLEDAGNWARTRISWIVAATSLGRVEDALKEAAHARDVFLQQGELYWVCIIDHNTAWIYTQTGRYRDALNLYERMLEIYPTLTDQSETYIKRAIAMAQGNRAINLSWLGEFEEAYRLHQQAQASFALLGETAHVINVEVNLANLDYTQGYYGSALRRYYHARDILLENNIDNPKLLAELKILMANALSKLNRAEEACQLAYEGVEIYRRLLGSSLQASNVLREYATTLVAAGRLEEALVALNEAEELFESGRFEHHLSATKLQRAELLLEMGSFAEAFDEAHRIKEYFETQGLAARSIRASLVMVGALIEQAQQARLKQEKEQQAAILQEAIALCKQVALQSRRHYLQEEVYKSQYLLGRLFALQGDTTKAVWHFGAAIAQIERILNDLLFDLSPSFLRTAWRVYEDMIVFCLQQGQTEFAFSYLERARSMALRQYLNITRTSAGEREVPGGNILSSSEAQANSAMILRIQHELHVWQERYRDYSVLLTQVDTSVSPSVEREVIQAELQRCEAKLSELFERLYLHRATSRPTTQAKKRKKGSGPYLDLTELRQHLLSNQLLLAYFLYKGKLVIFSITKEQITTHEIPDGGRQLKRLLPLLHAHLQVSGWPDPHQPPQAASRHMLNKLYQLLIAPVASLLPSSHGSLMIIPYGPLHQLPFHALYDGSRFLIEDFQVSYLPASSLLNITTGHASAGTSQVPLVFGYSGHGHLQRALEEAKTLATLLDGRCYLEDDATIARLIEVAPGSPIIHLATHGHSRLDAPNFSSVLLADGRFTAMDAFSLNLKGCELVTLSGCETGLALSGGGDEQLGLGRAFLAAGANTLVMSLWPVEDAATNELMQLFYQNLLRGESKAEALRAAQCALIRRTASASSHPYFWAAFRLVGSIGPLRYQETQQQSFTGETESIKK
jgi:CHAT domain-containing protein